MCKYSRRRPESTTLCHVVQEHLEINLALTQEGDWGGSAAPAHVEREFRRYLDCGIFAQCFASARCAECGHDVVIACSCYGRAVCPSCNTRRMLETAAHLVDHVFPPLPARQWVLSLPKRLRNFFGKTVSSEGAEARGRKIHYSLGASAPGKHVRLGQAHALSLGSARRHRR